MKKEPSNKKTNILPLADRVLVKPLSEEEREKKSSSGIILPETVEKEKPLEGKVLAVGPGKFDEDGNRLPMGVKPGDRVLFSKYGYDEVKMDDEEYYIISESNILAILTSKAS